MKVALLTGILMFLAILPEEKTFTHEKSEKSGLFSSKKQERRSCLFRVGKLATIEQSISYCKYITEGN